MEKTSLLNFNDWNRLGRIPRVCMEICRANSDAIVKICRDREKNKGKPRHFIENKRDGQN